MKTTNYQAREAARLGNQRAIETADDEAYQRRARKIREENIRRTKAAK